MRVGFKILPRASRLAVAVEQYLAAAHKISTCRGNDPD